MVLGSGSTVEIEDLPVLFLAVPANKDAPLSYRAAINALRKQMLSTALAKTSGNRAAAARLLGLEGRYFLRLMKSLGIEESNR